MSRIDLTPAETRLWHSSRRGERAMRAKYRASILEPGETLALWGAPTLPADGSRELVPGVLLATVRP